MLFNSISHYFYTYTTYCIQFIILAVLILLSYKAYCIQLNLDYKITMKLYTKLSITSYILCNILLILGLRIYTWGIPRDTNVIINKLLSYWNKSYLVSLIYCSLIILVLILLYKTKLYLTKQIIKQYLYTLYSPKGDYLLFTMEGHQTWWRNLFAFYSTSYHKYLLEPCTLRLNKVFLQMKINTYKKIIIGIF